MIQLENIEKIYQAGDIETLAINDVSLKINQGDFVSIMGPSGCGKSTLLNILGLLDNPDRGNLYFNNEEISRKSEVKKASIRKNNIGFIFQNFNLIDELSVFENVELPLIYSGISLTERKNKVNEVLDKVQMGHRKNHFPQQLSGGQQQRVAIARAIVSNPKLLLVDEPTGNLDSKNGNEVMKLITQLNESGTTVLMVTHSEHDARFGQKIIRMLDGKVVMEVN
jgi:putative ABC transport system ATP-binding protein